MHEQRIETARGPLAALRGGRAGGPPLLCLHGWLDNAASFVPLSPWLAEFDWVALDLPGHGASSHRAPGYDYAFADWLHDVLDVGPGVRGVVRGPVAQRPHVALEQELLGQRELVVWPAVLECRGGQHVVDVGDVADIGDGPLAGLRRAGTGAR